MGWHLRREVKYRFRRKGDEDGTALDLDVPDLDGDRL
jgi:hypothetical protein